MEVVGDYEYSKKDLIGHGAFAVVFKGRNRKRPSHVVAIKSITKKNLAKSQNLLSKEIKILKELSDLHHENVVALLDCKETTNHVYLVMEYCNGGDLADYLQAKGTLSEDTIASFLRQIAAAMKVMNGKGIVHRDLKPQNILLCHDGKANTPSTEMRLKIADFGFARFLNDGVMAATLCGSPMYMAPEVIMSLQYDAKADLWSIGTIVFQCLTGKAPFQAQTPQQLKHFYEKHAELKPNIPKDTSPELRDLLLKMLKRNAKDRVEFEDFFKHAFLQPQSAAASSSPVPVPGRASQGCSSESPTPPRCVSASPLSGKAEYSTPPSKVVQMVKQQEVTEPMQASQEGDFLKVDRGPTPRSNSPLENDFVLVPEGIGDHLDVVDQGKIPSPEDLQGFGERAKPQVVRVEPRAGSVAFKKNTNNVASPSRPSTLPMQQAQNQSEPIPVPTQVKAFERLRSCSSPHSNSNKSGMEISPAESAKSSGQNVKMSPQVESRFSAPDIGSFSPPIGTLKFSIGTPPSVPTPWRKSSFGSSQGGGQYHPANVSNSPNRRGSMGSSPMGLNHNFSSPGSLPTILDASPHFELNCGPQVTDNMPTDPVRAPFGHSRPRTIPDSKGTKRYNPAEVDRIKRNVLERCNTDPGTAEDNSMLSQQARVNYMNQQGLNLLEGQVTRYTSNEHLVSPNENTVRMDTQRAGSYLRRTFSATTPPSNLMFAQSPPNMEGPVTFVAPGLAEETLMGDNHNEIMAKLSFVNDLAECVMELAMAKGAPLNTLSESVNWKQGEGPLQGEPMPKFIESQRLLEQLVLYIRSLQLLSSSLQLARREIKDERLQVSNALKTLLKQMNERYHRCVSVCKHIQQRLGITMQNALTPQVVIATADKIIYNYAIEMCQTAALDELFGNPQECFKRYNTAHILLHSLSQQARNNDDKELLNKYKGAVERRLSHIHSSQDFYHTYDVSR
ncbi:serine/threonine-protein kinase ULK2-like isoform X3 [Ostrea edulis]|uniref:serine/threonine-protein kinase ULK2-like isoform X3 n=1 Tax=Ostrea edulis TaxID=37623 RepID=UPI0024AF14C1|nr:serine/threonine-protein kinase ULK2-like isoform X3 [Ostrea edulis]